MYNKQNIEAAGVSSCDLSSNVMLHIINMHGLSRIHNHC